MPLRRRIPPTKVRRTSLIALVAAVFAYPVFLTLITSLKTRTTIILTTRCACHTT